MEVIFKMEFENEESGTLGTKDQVCRQVEPFVSLEVGAEGPSDHSLENQG